MNCVVNKRYAVICPSHGKPGVEGWNKGESTYLWKGNKVVLWADFETEKEAYFFAHELGSRHFGYRFEIVPFGVLTPCH